MKAAFAAGLMTLLGVDAGAQGVTGSSVSRVDARADNGDDLVDNDDFLYASERLDATVTAGALRGAARVDGDLFLAAPATRYRSGLQLERLSLAWELGALTLSAGDFAAQLGRGLALAVRPLPEVGLDQVLRGARLDLDGEALGATVLVGLVNPANLDGVTLAPLDDPRDLVAGAELRALPVAGPGLTLLSSLVMPEERALPASTDWTGTLGTVLEVPDLAGVGRAGLEVDVQEHALAGVAQHGAAALGDLELALGDAVVLVETLYLGSFELKGSRNGATGMRFGYHQPPSLELLAQEPASDRDLLGMRVRSDLPLLGELRGQLDGMVRIADPHSAVPLAQAHLAAGLEIARGHSRFAARVGARTERLGLDKLAELRDLAHLDGDALVELGHGLAVHGVSALEVWRSAGRPWLRGSSSFSLDVRGRVAVGVEGGIDTQDPSPGVRHLFLAALTTLRLDERLELRVNAGSQRGGLACLGGVCRRVPPFAGTSAVLAWRF